MRTRAAAAARHGPRREGGNFWELKRQARAEMAAVVGCVALSPALVAGVSPRDGVRQAGRVAALRSEAAFTKAVFRGREKRVSGARRSATVCKVGGMVQNESPRQEGRKTNSIP